MTLAIALAVWIVVLPGTVVGLRLRCGAAGKAAGRRQSGPEQGSRPCRARPRLEIRPTRARAGVRRRVLLTAAYVDSRRARDKRRPRFGGALEAVLSTPVRSSRHGPPPLAHSDVQDAPPRPQRAGTADAEGDSATPDTPRDAIYRRLLACADLIAAAAAFVLAIPVLGNDSLGPLAFVAIAMVVPVCKLAGLYDRDQHIVHKTTLDEAPTVFYVASLYTLMAFLAGVNIVDGTFGREQALAFWGLLFVLMLAMRSLARRLAGMLVDEERCVILANADAAHWLSTKLKRSHGAKVHVVGRVPLSPDDTSKNELPLLGGFDALERLLRRAPGRPGADRARSRR